jgi:sec-independent protein translocase protein TatA
MKVGEEQSPKITGPVETERKKLETIAKSMGVNVEKTDDELRKMISEKMGQKKDDDPENN